MGFKLVRVHSTESYYKFPKISLPLGSHLIGRGKFLDCNDKRVSRNHAQLIVTKDSIELKSLHRNPCFLKRKSAKNIIIFSQSKSVVLYNGDQFGLTQDELWYEVIYCIEDSPTEPIDSNDVTNENPSNEGTANGNKYNNTQLNNHKEEDFCDSLLNAIVGSPLATIAKEAENRPENPSTDNFDYMDTTPTEQPVESTAQPVQSTDQPVQSTAQPVQSTAQPVQSTAQPVQSTAQPVQSTAQPVQLTDQPVQSIAQPLASTAQLFESTTQPLQSIDQPASSTEATTPSKRVHTEEYSPLDIKRVKKEPEDDSSSVDNVKTQPTEAAALKPVKTEPDSPQDAMPGPSNGQVGPTNDGKTGLPALPPLPTKAKLRERCMYGANCYRRNSQHKAQFSHPADTDWGSGERGVCPWGVACLRADPRHWRDHDHPPGVVPPPPRAPPRVNRPGTGQQTQFVSQEWSDEDEEDPYHTDGDEDMYDDEQNSDDEDSDDDEENSDDEDSYDDEMNSDEGSDDEDMDDDADKDIRETKTK